MDVSIKQFNCFTCEFDALQSGAVIKVEDVEVDNNALEHALKQIIDDHCLTQSAQRVCIRKFTVRQDDYEKLIGSNFFSAKLNGVAEPKGENLRWRELKTIIRMARERVN